MAYFPDSIRQCVAVLLGLAALIALPGTAHAAWFQTSSTHFVIYGEGSERSMRRFAGQLERYHAAMALVTGRVEEPPSPSNRVTIYIVRNVETVRRLLGGGAATRYVGGFYNPRAGQTIAVIPRITGDTDDIFDPSMATLLHEYAHHFLISGSIFPMPRWASEGAAEFFSSAGFEDDGAVQLGRPNGRRYYELLNARDVTATDLLDPDAYERRRARNTSYDSFYGKSWLLYHYLSLGTERRGQLNTYYQSLIAGKSSPEAATAAFGDLTELERELDRYLRRPRLLTIVVPADRLEPGPVALRALSAGEVAMMPVLVRSRSGVNAELAQEVLIDARAVAARFPGDAAVQAALAEAEFDAGNDAEAITAADAALAADPAQVNAYVQKGYALFRIAENGTDPRAYTTARHVFVDLNRLEPNHPLPLIWFYRSYQMQGREPTPLAVQGLTRAAELAPFDIGLRMNLAMQQLRDGNRDAARLNLVPVAYHPHGGSLAAVARAVIERMDANPDWRGEGTTVPTEEDAATEEPGAS